MPDRAQIETLYKEFGTYSAVAKHLAISRQRVHQIARGYKHFGRANREKLYKYFKDICEKCKTEPSSAFHHIDGNNENDSPDNLLSVCQKCHYQVHIVLRNGGGYKNKVCKKCNQVFTLNTPQYLRLGYHYECRPLIDRSKIFCLKCKIPWKSGFSLGLCKLCYRKEKYKNDPIFREKLKLKIKESYNRNREKRLAAMKVWQQNNKEKLKEYRLKYYAKKIA